MTVALFSVLIECDSHQPLQLRALSEASQQAAPTCGTGWATGPVAIVAPLLVPSPAGVPDAPEVTKTAAAAMSSSGPGVSCPCDNSPCHHILLSSAQLSSAWFVTGDCRREAGCVPAYPLHRPLAAHRLRGGVLRGSPWLTHGPGPLARTCLSGSIDCRAAAAAVALSQVTVAEKVGVPLHVLYTIPWLPTASLATHGPVPLMPTSLSGSMAAAAAATAVTGDCCREAGSAPACPLHHPLATHRHPGPPMGQGL